MSFLKEPLGSVRSLISKFRSGTTLGEPPKESRAPIPDNVIEFMMHANKAGHVDPDIVDIDDMYEYARQEYNKRAGGKEAFEKSAGAPKDDTPVSRLTTLRGAIAAYWTGEKWKQAWAQTVGLTTLTVLNAQNTVWVTESMAKVVDAVAKYQDPNMMSAVLGAAGVATAYATAKLIGEAGSQYFRDNLQRGWGVWMTDRFKKASFQEPDTLYRITHNQEEGSTAPDAMPDSPYQRMSGAPTMMARHFINITQRGLSTVMTGAFVIKALAENSVPIEALDRLGATLNSYMPNGMIDLTPGQAGTLLLTGAVVGTHLAVTGPVGKSISNKIEEAYKILQQKEGKFTERLVKMFNNSEGIAASRGHKAFEETFDQAHKEIDEAIKDEQKGFRKYLMFMDAQNFGKDVLSLIPAVASLTGRHASASAVEIFMTTRGLTSTLLDSVSYVVEVLPEYARFKADGKRMTELAQMFELVRDKKKFYSMTGIHEFEGQTLRPDSGEMFTMSDVEIMHRGQTQPFLTVPEISINEGDWVHIRGKSGSGKSSLLKAMTGLWPYGRGKVGTREDTSVFYAYQEPDLSGPYTLEEQVVYGMQLPQDFTFTPEIKLRIANALAQAGLGEYTDQLDKMGVGEKPWYKILSGGQKQRLVLARMLFQQPDVILLDEPTLALDPKARTEYFDLLRAGCPNSTLLVVTHDKNPQSHAQFNRQIHIEDRVASITPSLDEEMALEANHVAEHYRHG